jgi:NAD(P)-dependent dehydrogenase (short-subunit alcohol dehydrogenase family)
VIKGARPQVRPCINISFNGRKGQFRQVNYSATTAGDIGFTKVLALENANGGITVNVMATFIVRVWDEPHLVTTERKSKTVWVGPRASAGTNGTVARTGPKAAVECSFTSSLPKRQREALRRQQLFRH